MSESSECWSWTLYGQKKKVVLHQLNESSDSQVARVSDWKSMHTGDAGAILWCGKGFFSQSQLSGQTTVLCCLYTGRSFQDATLRKKVQLCRSAWLYHSRDSSGGHGSRDSSGGHASNWKARRRADAGLSPRCSLGFFTHLSVEYLSG